MARIVNLNTRKVEEVEDDSVNSLITEGTHGFLANEEISVLESTSGASGTLPANEAIREIKKGGYSYLGEKEKTRRGLEEKYGGAGQQAIGVAEQLVSGLTMGGSELIEQAMGVPVEDIEGRGVTAGAVGDIANFAGMMAPFTKAAQGVKVLQILGAPVRAVDKLGMGAEAIAKVMLNKSLKNKVLKRSAELGTRAAVEGSLFNSSEYLKEVALGNKDYNAEALMSAGVSGLKTGALLGGALGGASELAIKTARKAKLKIGKDLKKFSGVDDADGGLRLNTKGKDLKQKDLSSDTGGKGSEFYLDEDSGLYKYTDSSREVHIDPAKIKGKTLTLTDADELNKIGAQLEIPNLAEEIKGWDSSKTGFSEHLSDLRQKALHGRADEIISGSISRIDRNTKVNSQLEKIRSGYNRHRKIISNLQSKEQTPLVLAKIKKSRSKISELQKKYKKTREKYRGIEHATSNRFNDSRVDEEVAAVLDNYSAIKIGDRIVVKNLGSLDDAISSATSIGTKRKIKSKISLADSKTLNLSGAQKAFFRNKTVAQQEELAVFIRKNFRTEANKRLINHPLLTDLDDLMANVETTRLSSIEEMDASINRMENLLQESGLSSTVTGSQIANAIDKHVYPKYFNKQRGRPYPNLEQSAEAVHKFSDSIRKFGKDTATGVDIPFSPRELRELRINMDNFPGLDFDKTQSLSRELVKTARREMEESLVAEMSKFDDATGFVKKYKEAKKNYGMAMETNKILENRFSKENANNAISLTGYIAAGTGAGIGGMQGAVAALGMRELGRAYGNNLMALYADKIVGAQGSLSNKITKSVKGFLKSSSSIKITPLVGAVSKRDINDEYNKDVKEINAGKYDFEAFAEDFTDNNQGLIASLPNTANILQKKMGDSYAMLMEKLPKNPYEGSSLRKFQPADSDIRKFHRYKEALLNPASVFTQIEKGTISNEAIEVLERIHPATYKVMQFEMMEELSSEKEVGYKKRNQINKLFKIQTDNYQRVDNVILLQEMIKNPRVEDERKEEGQKIKGNKKSTRSKSNMTAGQRMLER